MEVAWLSGQEAGLDDVIFGYNLIQKYAIRYLNLAGFDTNDI